MCFVCGIVGTVRSKVQASIMASVEKVFRGKRKNFSEKDPLQRGSLDQYCITRTQKYRIEMKLIKLDEMSSVLTCVKCLFLHFSDFLLWIIILKLFGVLDQNGNDMINITLFLISQELRLKTKGVLVLGKRCTPVQ